MPTGAVQTPHQATVICSGDEGVSTQPPLGRIPIKDHGKQGLLRGTGQYTYAGALADIASQVDAHGFDSHSATPVFSPEYVRLTPVILLDQLPIPMFVYVHRSGYRPLTTTHLAQDVKKSVPIFIACHVVQRLKHGLA